LLIGPNDNYCSKQNNQKYCQDPAKFFADFVLIQFVIPACAEMVGFKGKGAKQGKRRMLGKRSPAPMAERKNPTPAPPSRLSDSHIFLWLESLFALSKICHPDESRDPGKVAF
jgi:hypothetical protein